MTLTPLPALTPVTDDPRTPLRRVLIVAAALIAICLLPFASGLVGALMLYALVGPLHRRLVRRMSAHMSAAILATAVLVLLLIPGAWLLSTIASEARSALTPANVQNAFAWLERTRLGSIDVSKDVNGMITSIISWLSGRAVTVVGTLTSAIINLVLALFGLYYLLIGAGPLWARTKRLLPVPDAIAEQLAVRFVDVTNALVLGTLLTASLQGTLVGVGFAIVGLQPAILWGFVTACFSILPVLGSGIVWLPAVILLFVNHHIGQAIFLLALGGGIASNIDNLARPLVYKRVSGIHPMLTLVGGFAGVKVFGLIGVFLGPLMLSYFVELLDVYDAMTRTTIA